jgi:hypothetical protein
LAGAASGAACARVAEEPFAWTPPRAPAVVRGREAGNRFGLLALHEVTVEIDNVFAAANRQALALAEQRLAEIPGVRAVFGPAGLLDISVGASGTTRARPVLSRGTSETEGEAARQRVVRRADALGWFLTENGRRARFLIDTADWPRVAPAINAALVSSGLGLASASARTFEERPLWPDPRSRGRFLPFELAAAWVFFVLVAARRAQLTAAPGAAGRRRVALAVAAALGAAAPFGLVRIGGIVALAGLAALGAALVALLAEGSGGAATDATGDAGAGAGPSRWLAALAALLVLAGLGLSRRVRVETRQWGAAPLFFVSVRGDFDEPVVLREVRRMADDLRAQPGVANAWSVADLFTGVTFEGEDPSRIPDDPDQVRRILVQGRSDPAVRLELAGDHREGLVAVRFDDDPTIDHQAIVTHLVGYIELELRRALLHVDVDAPGVPPVTRSLGRSLLAIDARERVLRICDRSGRALGPAEALSVERVARQAATIPAADPAKLDAEVAETVRAFIAHHPFPLGAGETARLIATIRGLGDSATVDDVRVAVAAAYGARLPDAILRTTAATLARRVALVRRRLVARGAFRDMLYGAELPTEGVLADEVRGATADAMGPVVGIPVALDNPAAFRIDAVPIGGAPNDRVLSEAWNRALPAGVVWAIGLIALLLAWLGGPAGLLSLPLALAPLATAAAPAAILREPIGLATIAFLAGAFAGGAALAVAATAPLAPRRWR